MLIFSVSFQFQYMCCRSEHWLCFLFFIYLFCLSLLFNMLSRLVIIFLPRSKCLLIS